MTATLITLAVTAVLFAIGRLRSDLVALCALLTLMLLDILTPEEALSGFSNSVVIMMVGLFVVGGAICNTGLAKMLGGRLMRLAGDNELRLFLLVMLVTAFIGAFVSNTGTVALMLPIVVSMATRSHINTRRLLMPLAFASSLGGMLTLIGTPPNLVIQQALTDAGYAPLKFFSFTPVGIVCIAVGILVLLPLSRLFLGEKKNSDTEQKPGRKSLEQLVEEYRLDDNLQRYTVASDSPLKGKTVAELDIHNRYGLSVLEIRRETSRQKGIIRSVSQKMAGPKTIFEEGDIIYLSGEKDQAARFATDHRLASSPADAAGENTLSFYDIGIAEIVVLPTSRLVSQPLRQSGFRSKHAVNVVGIRRKGQYIKDDLPNVRLHSGDVLLVQGTWTNINRLTGEDGEWVVLGQPLEEAARVTFDYKAPLAAFILLLMVGAMAFDFIPVAPVTAVMLAAVLMVLCGCFRNVEAAYQTINWESIVLIGAMLPMSTALQKTGASSLVSSSLVGMLGGSSPYLLMAGIYLTTSLLSFFISNTATAVLMAPIALSAAQEMGLSPYPFLFAVTLGASMCFASPFSTPPNALVMQAGRYSFMDYIKVGLPLQLIIGAVMVVVLPLLWPF